MAETEEFTKQKWWYAGQRAGRTTKVVIQFVDEEGNERVFKKGRDRFVIGHAYEVEANSTSAKVSGATLLPDEPKHPETMTWNMEEVAFKTGQEQERLVKRLQEDNEFEDMLDALQLAYAKMRTRGESGAFLGYVNARITWKSRNK